MLAAGVCHVKDFKNGSWFDRTNCVTRFAKITEGCILTFVFVSCPIKVQLPRE